MESVPTSPTPFVRRLHVGPNDTVADGALALSLQSTLDVASECDEAFDDAAGAENDDLKHTEP